MKRDGAVLAVAVIAAIVGIATGDGYRLYVIAMVGLTADARLRGTAVTLAQRMHAVYVDAQAKAEEA